MDMEIKIIEINHFIIQTIRIPLTEEPSIKKTIQLLNIVNIQIGGKKKWMKLENYLTKNNINKINNRIKI